ncbi:S-adenosyl-L-methionine-dependent methyltransferase [Gaertneriomyces semiglobifer]|nr:S-adenosyl-L-methionine-dependent methyltransferase [Gaertneriomyces semiglobifer]
MPPKAKPGSKSAAKKKARESARLEAVFKLFSTFFATQYGEERWQKLHKALEAEQRYACLVNRYADPADVVRALLPVADQLSLSPYFANRYDPALALRCFTIENPAAAAAPTASGRPGPFPPPVRDMSNNLSTYYLLDLSSLLATQALDVAPHHRVLDTCASPGGKSLAIFQRLGEKGKLHVNEPNNERRKHLRRVLDEYCPQGTVGNADQPGRISVSGMDLSKRRSGEDLPGGIASFDRVLVDAPCSSERHLIHSPADLAQWTVTHTKTMAKRQRAILSEALRACKIGGKVVYATCSLSDAENDSVVEWVRDKFNDAAVIIEENPNGWGVGEKTRCGWLVLPDVSNGWGPLYFAVLHKVGNVRETGRSRGDYNDDYDFEDDEEYNSDDFDI